MIPNPGVASPAANRAAYSTRFLRSFSTLIQGKDGWLFRTDDDLRSSFGPDAAGYADLKRFNAALKARGTELVMVYQPSRGLMHPDKLPASARRQFNPEAARAAYRQALHVEPKSGLDFATNVDLKADLVAPHLAAVTGDAGPA